MLMDILMSERLAIGGLSNIIWCVILCATLGAGFMAIIDCISGSKQGFKKLLVQTSKMFAMGAALFPFYAAALAIFTSIGVVDEYWTRPSVLSSFLTGELTRAFVCYILIAGLLVVVISVTACWLSRLIHVDEKG